MLDPRSAKRALRLAIRARILAMPTALRAGEEAALADRLEALPGFDRAGLVLLYASAFPEEFDTAPLIRRAFALGRRVALPRVERPSRRLALVEIGPELAGLSPGAFAIPEPRPDAPEVSPEAIDWALVPGLGFDRSCARIGRGAGYYDRLLPTLRPDTPRWALCLSSQWEDAIPVEPHDARLDGVADPDRLVTRP